MTPRKRRRISPPEISTRLSENAARRLQLATARADEVLISAHVENALHLADALTTELPPVRAIDIYVRVLGLPPALAEVVARRARLRVETRLAPFERIAAGT